MVGVLFGEPVVAEDVLIVRAAGGGLAVGADGAQAAGGAPGALEVGDGLAWRAPGALTREVRRELRRQLAAGDLDELTFRATTFRASYPNSNFYRFRDEHLPAFAASFAGQPYLRDHATYAIDARGGTVDASALDGRAFVQDIRLTVPRDIEAFLNGQMDRFSIGWYWKAITCSVCGNDWLSRDCSHWPGQTYEVDKKPVQCELIFEEPRGKETSAVNAPAVAGTGVQGMLAELVEQKIQDSRLKIEDGAAARGRNQTEYGQAMGALAEGDHIESPVRGGLDAPEWARAQKGFGGTMDENTVVDGQAAVASPAGGAPVVPAVDVAAVAALMAEQRRTILDARLRESGLPAEMTSLVREMLPANWTPADLDIILGRVQGSVAALESSRVVTGMHPTDTARVSGMLTSVDQATLAIDALVAGVAPARGVRPLSGIREAYTLLSGDYEMQGRFMPENVGLANVNSSTMAGIVANAMNKALIGRFQQYPRWWEKIVTTEDFTTLQQVRWITLGGVGELPTVSEGQAYTELTWDDNAEVSSWAKKGGYLGITLEAIDRDDTRSVQRAPAALAQAAWLTLSKAIAGIFTTNAVLADGLALFHNTHGNLGSTALSFSAWSATRTLMRKASELNSAERLGALVAPKYLLVPPDLETTALQILGSDEQPGVANNDINPFAGGTNHDELLRLARERVIVVDFWTDATDWVAMADPMLYPSIGLGFRFGRAPEIFSVASPTSGLMFTNDVMPVKVRFTFAAGPVDYRGMYKHVV